MSRAVEFHLCQSGLNYFCVPFTGSITITLSVLAVCIVAFTDAASGSCPLPSKIYSCSPKCVQNYDCSHGKVCCPNSCNTKSCVDLASFGGANNGKDKYSQCMYLVNITNRFPEHLYMYIVLYQRN
ncbi:salivary cysteine-rich peptide precursor [Danaus plexippus plexippus]|uniref:Salivary cysteine-rich peptide n=1 Tax=Danaus plexippus plexippus TaxID=278856 RepID=A0A212FP79_DANPL|nr:salivary cysteine-rich peptide precursor [Danaus plexippus plexippus]